MIQAYKDLNYGNAASLNDQLDQEIIKRALEISRYDNKLKKRTKPLINKGLKKLVKTLFKPVTVKFEDKSFKLE